MAEKRTNNTLLVDGESRPLGGERLRRQSATYRIQAEKVLFVVREIELGSYVANQLRNDDFSRIVARRVLVRLSDLIEITRVMRRDVIALGGDYADLKLRREALDAEYRAHFKLTRDKLGAHFQDLDFSERLDLWQDIEKAKLSYFVDGAREIFDCLQSMRLPGQPTYSSPPEIGDLRFSKVLSSMSGDETPNRVVAASDILALARPNTVATLNLTPVHQRAAQLTTIDRWVDHVIRLLREMESFPSATRFLMAQLVTDVVSYADALVTREDASAKQQLDGLNALVDGSGRAAVDRFIAAFRFRETIEPLRDVRNEIGAHVDADSGRTLDDILFRLDRVTLRDLTTLHSRLRAAFHAVCREVAYLRMYGMKETVLYGVTGSSSPVAQKPFDPDETPPLVSPPLVAPEPTRRAIDSDLKIWCKRDPNAAEARGRLWQASTAGPIVERTQRTDKRPIEFRLVHTRLLRFFHKADGDRLDRLLELMKSLAGGCPDPLAEILRRQTRRLPTPSPSKLLRILLTLGELPVSEPQELREFLGRFYSHPILEVRRAAMVADFAIGSLVVAQVPHSARSLIQSEFMPTLEKNPAAERVATGLTLGGQLVGGKLWFQSEQHEDEYRSLVEWLGRAIPEAYPSAAGDALDQLLGAGDFCGVGVHVSDLLAQDDPGRAILLTAVDQWIALSRDYRVGLQSQINRGIAYLRLERPTEARETVDRLWGAVSHSPGLLVAMLGLYSSAGGDDVSERSEEIRRHFNLSPELERELDAIELEAQNRANDQR